MAKIHIVASDFLGDHRKVRRTGTTARAVLTDIRPRYAASVRFSKRVGGGRERGFVARWLGSGATIWAVGVRFRSQLVGTSQILGHVVFQARLVFFYGRLSLGRSLFAGLFKRWHVRCQIDG